MDHPKGLRRERLAALVLRANLEPFDARRVNSPLAHGPEPVEGQATQSGARRIQVRELSVLSKVNIR